MTLRQAMDCRRFIIYIWASWLCLTCTGLQQKLELELSETGSGGLFSNCTEDSTFSETENITTNGSAIANNSTTSQPIETPLLPKTTRNLRNITTITVSESTVRGGLVPMAAGGIGLLCGLVFLAFVVGVFLYWNRNTNYVYEQASASEAIINA